MENVSRREFIEVGSAGALSVALQRRANKRPNFLFFMSDDQRADSMGCAGNPILKTPNMDRLAREGVRFTNAFVTNSLCGPSRATCMTGLYSHNTGVRVNDGTFPREQITFLEMLRGAGYKSAFVGKWHNKNFGRERNLDYYFGFKGQGQYHNPMIAEQSGPDREYQGWIEDIMADHSIEFIRQHRRQAWALCHWSKGPHALCEPPERLKDLYRDATFPRPETFYTDYKDKPRAVKEADMKIGGSGRDSYIADWDSFVRSYYQVLTGLDENVGRILNALDGMGLTENTVVIYTSDNGCFLGEFGFFDKRLMYEPSIRVPLLVRYSRMIKPATVCEEMALNIDHTPTILDLAGMKVSRAMDGRSLRPLLESRSAGWRQDFLYEYYEYPGWHSVKACKGVRTKRWKYIEYYDHPKEFELYDLVSDPNEVRNLYGDPNYRDVIAKLRQRLLELRKEARDPDLKYE